VGTLTIGVPAFFLALAPNSRRYVPGFVGRVVRFALPSGVIVAAAVFASTWASARLGADALQTRTVATIVLTLCGLAVIEVIERPLTGWRLGIVAAMLVGLIGSTGIAAAGAAWALLSVAARFAGPRERSA
jgi:cation-transporting ATPase E